MKFCYLILIFALLSGQKKPGDTEEVNALINEWHSNAAKPDLEKYFASVSENFVFLGTAPGERWERDEFYAFCKPYFAKGSGWDFKSSNRKWVFNKKKNMAWFDEDLETWMEGCRGSGICVKQKGEWKLSYYNLTVLIENDKIQKFIDLRKE